MSEKYNFSVTLHPWGESPENGIIGIDTAALYGYFERKDGSEGGGLWFEHQGEKLSLIDFDGTACLPSFVARALRGHGVIVDSDFE